MQVWSSLVLWANALLDSDIWNSSRAGCLESWRQHGIEPQWWCIEKDQYLALLGPFCSFLLFLATFYAKMRKSRVQLIGSLESELPAAFYSWKNTTMSDSMMISSSCYGNNHRRRPPSGSDSLRLNEGRSISTYF
jgi:hypothetical protein